VWKKGKTFAKIDSETQRLTRHDNLFPAPARIGIDRSLGGERVKGDYQAGYFDTLRKQAIEALKSKGYRTDDYLARPVGGGSLHAKVG
jgi:hypothetical protein